MAKLLPFGEFPGRAKVYDLDDLVLLQAYVLWLQISVDITLLVQVVDGREHLKHDLGSILFSEFGPLHNFIKEFATLQEVRNEIEVNTVFVYFI